MTPNFRDVFFLAPEIVLTVWGLVVLLVDLGLARRLTPAVRRRTIGLLALAGVGVALAAAVLVCFVPLMVRAYPQRGVFLAQRAGHPRTSATPIP